MVREIKGGKDLTDITRSSCEASDAPDSSQQSRGEHAKPRIRSDHGERPKHILHHIEEKADDFRTILLNSARVASTLGVHAVSVRRDLSG